MEKRERLEWVDGHLDLAYLAVGGRDMGAEAPAGGAVSFPALAEGSVGLVLGTIFVQRR